MILVKDVQIIAYPHVNFFSGNKLQGDQLRVMVIASGDLWAGAEVMIYQLACGLSNITDLELLVVLLNKGRLAKELEKQGIEVRIVDEYKLSFFSLVRAVGRLVAEFYPDVIHSHRYKENLLTWLVTCRRKNIKLVATQHGMPERTGQNISLAERLRTSLFFRLLSYGFDHTVLVSGEMRQVLVGSYGFSEKKVVVIHNGISIPEVIPHFSGQRIVVGSAGRLFPVKDFSLLVDIAHQVILQNDTVDFVLAGDGPQFAELADKINKYDMKERFCLLGHQGDMEAFYQSLDVYINTSVHEGIPMSVLEAMSYGLPVVASHVGGFSEIVQDSEQGFLIEGRNMNAYVECVLKLILDQELRLKMAKSARRRVIDCFSREAMTQKYYQLYQEVNIYK